MSTTFSGNGYLQSRRYALIDGALLQDLPELLRRRWPIAKAVSLFGDSADAAAVTVGPLLFELEPEAGDGGFPADIVDAAAGMSVGSVLESQLQAAELARRLSPFTDVRLDDGSVMVMRFFDPRVLPAWLEVLPGSYRAELGRLVNQWIHLDYSREVKVHRFDAHDTAVPEFPWAISVQQEQRLIDRCFPFTLIARFSKEDPDALSKIPPSQRYVFFDRQIDRCRCHGLDAVGDIEVWCGLAFELGEDFSETATFAKCLAAVKGGGSLSDALERLDEDDWARMRFGT